MKYLFTRIAARHSRRLTILLPLLVLCITITPQSAWAGEFTWTGGGDATTWSSSANWTLSSGTDDGGNNYPSGADNATFDGTGTAPSGPLTGTISATSLTVSGHAVTMGANGTFAGNVTVSGGSLDMATYNLDVSGTTTVSGGTFSAGSGTHTLSGAVSITAGTYNAGTGTTYFANNLTINSTFNQETSTLEFLGTSAQTISSNADRVLYNIIHSGTATLNFTGTGGTRTFTINGTFTKTRARTTSLTSATLAYAQNGTSKLYYTFGTPAIFTVTSEFPTSNGPSNLEVSNNGFTITLQNSNYTVSNNLTLTAGTLAAGNAANTVFVGGTLSTGTLTTTGRFTVGTIQMNGASAQTQSITGGGGGTNSVSNLTINRPLANDVIQLTTGILKITGTLNIQSGILEVSSAANQLDVSGATFTIGASGTFRTGGKTISSTGTTFDFQNGSTFEFNGSVSTESFPTDGSATGYTYGNVIINNSAEVDVPTGITIEVVNNLTFAIDNGLVVTGATNSKGDLLVNGTISGASSVRYVNGPLRVPFSSTGLKDFPVGYSTNYLPAVFNYTAYTGGTSIIEVEAKGGDPTGTPPAGISLISADHYYTVKEVGTAPSSLTYTFTGTWTGTGYAQARNALIRQIGTGPNTYSYTTPQSTSATQVTTASLNQLPTNAGIFAFGYKSGNAWTGAVSTNWNTAGNWSLGTVPDETDDVTVGVVGTSRYPLISPGIVAKAKTLSITGSGVSVTLGGGGTSPSLEIKNAVANSLTVGAGATLTVNSLNTLPILFVNAGGIYSATATTFNGTVQYTNSGATPKVPDDQYANLTLSGVNSTGTAVNVSGNLVVNTTNVTSGTITLNGSSPQTINATANLFNLTVNNTSGGVSLNTSVTLGGTLTLTSGLVTPGANTLTVAGTSGGSASSYVNGPLTISGTGSKTFPIGLGGYFRPVIITTTNAATTFQLVNGNPGGTPVSPLTRISTLRYWIGNGGIQAGSSIQLSYDPIPDGVNVYNTINVSSSTSQSGSYNDRGGTTGGSGNYIPSWGLYATNQSNINLAGSNPEYFALATTSTTDDNPLPVELISFEGTSTENGINLTWQTGSEKDSRGFILSRRVEGTENWSVLASHSTNSALKATNSLAGASYAFGDHSEMMPGDKFEYRLEEEDLTGTRVILDVITVESRYNTTVQSFALGQNYPNPFNPTTKIAYNVKQSAKVTIDVFNMLGQKVKTLVNAEMARGSYEVQLNANDLSSGIYFYRMVAASASGSFVESKKMVLLK